MDRLHKSLLTGLDHESDALNLREVSRDAVEPVDVEAAPLDLRRHVRHEARHDRLLALADPRDRRPEHAV